MYMYKLFIFQEHLVSLGLCDTGVAIAVCVYFWFCSLKVCLYTE